MGKHSWQSLENMDLEKCHPYSSVVFPRASRQTLTWEAKGSFERRAGSPFLLRSRLPSVLLAGTHPINPLGTLGLLHRCKRWEYSTAQKGILGGIPHGAQDEGNPKVLAANQTRTAFNSTELELYFAICTCIILFTVCLVSQTVLPVSGKEELCRPQPGH